MEKFLKKHMNVFLEEFLKKILKDPLEGNMNQIYGVFLNQSRCFKAHSYRVRGRLSEKNSWGIFQRNPWRNFERKVYEGVT